jgi:tetratricopeptide (TPR) repeat protein
MSPEPDAARRQRALILFRELLDLDLDPAARALELAQRCGDDAALRIEVERLCALDALDAPIDRGAHALLPGTGPEPRLGRRVGPFRLDAVLGEGGMGTVFRASRVDGAFEQQVALKLIRGGVDGAAARLRFERERAILARLDHPDLAPLLDGGVADDGTPWYAMPLFDAQPLTAWCDAHRLPLRERVALLARICDAVQAAHQSLVVHRDLKPSNIVVDARGAPHVLDFGIAKLLDEADDASQTATRLMTPAYAAPEQVRGEPVSTATDVFALGVILYELACGRHPFDADESSAFALQRAVVEAEPHRFSVVLGENTARAAARAQQRQSVPWRLRRELRGDFTRIVAKALAKAPAQRYVSAAALGEDLLRWLRGDAVQATPASLGYRAGTFLRRWRWPLAGAAAVLLALVAATAISLRQAEVAREAQRQAEAHAQSALAAQRFMEDVFLAAEPWTNEGTPPDALQLADRAFETIEQDLADQPRARADLYYVLARLYVTAGSRERAVESAQRAVALYDTLPTSVQRRVDAHLRLAYAFGMNDELDRYERAVDDALALEGTSAHDRAHILTMRAEVQRERGRYDLMASTLETTLPSFEQDSPLWYETLYARADAARMRRHHADAARDFARYFLRDGSRGWRALIAMQALGELPEALRRPEDLDFAASLEAEGAAVWADGFWQARFAGLRAGLHLQHADLEGALVPARSLRSTQQSSSYDAQYRLVAAYVRLAAGEREPAAQEFDRIATLLQPISDALDPRPILARAGAACARGESLPVPLRDALAQPPQPEYLGYAWLRIAPCAELHDSAAARTPDPQPHAPTHGAELRAALDVVAARLGECQNGARVAVGAPCPALGNPD